MSRKAMQMALEALEWVYGGAPVRKDGAAAIRALRAALAQQDEPVAWPAMPPSKGQSPVLFEDGYAEGWAKCLSMCKSVFEHTNPQPPRQPLTREDAIALWKDRSDGPSNAEIVSYCRAVEAAHGITGEQK
jgi:hypothetical protein